MKNHVTNEEILRLNEEMKNTVPKSEYIKLQLRYEELCNLQKFSECQVSSLKKRLKSLLCDKDDEE